ncbi:serine dehydratase subunit alpha family protein [Treponema parvum]|uniref:Serine dehydratase subunit alpha family protein n=2 Tax=Treponema parvum TaxID=138851 RepID=A0A975F6B4_9SPIR|nr:serine dehydratase subunit alpha family protein [Treponema parvum]
MISDLLKQEMILAMGCTEPAACALAGAKAAELLDGRPVKIEIYTTRDILKNAMGVHIPGFDKKGVKAAVCLGIAVADVSEGLDILSTVSPVQKQYASGLNPDLELIQSNLPLYIKVVLSNEKHSSVAVISGSHTSFSHIEKDGVVLKDKAVDSIGHKIDPDQVEKLTLSDIVTYSKNMPKEIEILLEKAIDVNMKIAEQSLNEEYGLSVGKTLMKELPPYPKTLQDAYNLGAALAAGGSDARMAGCQLPVMINSGSGNQGMTLSIPIAVVAKYLKKSQRDTAQALCIAELVGLMLSAKKGRLSAQCGAFTAAIGTGCGLAFLQGGTKKVMERVVDNMIGNLTGIVCDGAKMTCALKIYSCLQSAFLSIKLAFAGLSPDAECGIIGNDMENSVDNLSYITHDGMEQVDKNILDIMLNKEKCASK